MASYISIDRSTPSPGPKERQDGAGKNVDRDPALRYRIRGLFLIALYFPLLLIPWAVTLVIADRPFSHGSYIKHSGFLRKDIITVEKWVVAINVLNSIASIVTIPILSALLAQAAVVYSQRRSHHQHLSVRHLFALADRGWSDLDILYNAWRWKERGSRSVRTFLYLALGLILTSVVQQPLYQILVTFQPRTVTTCADTLYIRLKEYGYSMADCDPMAFWEPRQLGIGFDVEPAQMAVMDQTFTIARINSELASISHLDTQPHLWWDYADNGSLPDARSQPTLYDMSWKKDHSRPSYDEDPEYSSIPDNRSPRRMFVAALLSDTTTGVLRQHAMRFNSTVECKPIEQSQFPKECAGEKPFQAEIKRRTDKDTGIKVCAPGEYDKFPWTLSRNRQDIMEELYIGLNIYSNSDGGHVNTTIYCKASTTRGYFELGNVYNNQTYGPLMEKWPTRDDMWRDYNDFLGHNGIGGPTETETNYIPSEENPIDMKYTVEETAEHYTPGPLMSSAIALFGGESWYQLVDSVSRRLQPEESISEPEENQPILWKSLCELTPFARINPYPISYCEPESSGIERFRFRVNEVLLKSSYVLERSLATSIFLANKALLSAVNTHGLVAEIDGLSVVGRSIYSSPGMVVQIPVLSTTAKIIISILIAVQFIGLVALTIFIYHIPTWTTALNAAAMARVGANLEPNTLPPLRPMGRSDMDKLKDTSGLFGMNKTPEYIEMQSHRGYQIPPDVEDFLRPSDSQGQTDLPVEAERSNPQMGLQLGAPGIITRKATIP